MSNTAAAGFSRADAESAVIAGDWLCFKQQCCAAAPASGEVQG